MLRELNADPFDTRTLKFIDRKASGILDMIEGFGMVPPEITIMKDSYDRANGTYGFKVHRWEDEHE